jgi:stage III sporulation protein AA
MKQMLEFLPKKLIDALKYLNMKYVYELRLRADKPVFINYKGNYTYLSRFGVSDNINNAISVNREEIENAVFYAGKFSIYTIEEQIKQGFITAEGGIRIGLAGEYVLEKGNALTIRNISSICIRIPHEIIGAAEEIFYRCMSDKIVNLLVASLPGCGKTTILRDLSRIISQKLRKNVLICDERGEISALGVADTCDTFLFADKITAFSCGVRTMRPDVIITDELSAQDVNELEKLVASGVCVIASIHAEKIEQLSKNCYAAFDKIVFLKSGRMGEIDCIYQKFGSEFVAL